MLRFALLSAFLVTLAATLPARAQSSTATSEEWRVLGDGAIAARTTPGAPGAGGNVRLVRVDKQLAKVGDPISVYDGAVDGTGLAVHGGSAAVVVARGGKQPFITLAVVDLATRAVRLVP